MKQILLLLSIILFSIKGTFAQVTVANEKENIAYLGVDNPLSFAVFDFPCQDVTIKVDNGILINVPNQCGKFIYQPGNAGSAKFSVFAMKDGKLMLIDMINFRVVNPPRPTEVFLSIKNPEILDEITGECCASTKLTNANTISVTQIPNALGLGCSLNNFNYTISYNIKKFDYVIKRNNMIIKKGTNNGAKCGDTCKEDLKLTQAGDVIIFDNIHAEFNNLKYTVQEFEINITN